jgi:catechol 2,3-dioxygenase-like lactoylglutathione lyase family enzyme
MKWTIHHINLPTHDVGESSAFYRDVLGLEQGAPHTIASRNDRVDNSANRMAVIGDRNRGIHLNRPIVDLIEKTGTGVNPSTCVHLAIEVDDLDAVRERLKAAGIYFVDVGDRFVPGLKQIYVYDPSGHLLEINTETPPGS